MLILSTAKVVEALLPFIIFAVIFGFKIISAIVKKVKEDNGSYRETEEDMWQPQTREASEPPTVPQQSQRQGKRRRRDVLTQAEETHPEGISMEAASAVMVNERSDDRFEMAQDRAYDLQSIDAPMTSDMAFTIGNKTKRQKKKVRVSLKSKQQIRNAMITREIMERPRCFDI